MAMSVSDNVRGENILVNRIILSPRAYQSAGLTSMGATFRGKDRSSIFELLQLSEKVFLEIFDANIAR
jgi:hypothetical protein